MSQELLNSLKAVKNSLQAFEEKNKINWPNGQWKFPHWYKLVMFSDGSGHVEDTSNMKLNYIIKFDKVEELYEQLER